MQKVYLLLRDNRETGPYSLEELVQMGLKSYDLIWVEGKSFGWSYPAEIELLKPYAPELPEIAKPKEEIDAAACSKQAQVTEGKTSIITETITPKKIFVSLPGGIYKKELAAGDSLSEALEKKAEELRRRAQVYSEVKKENSLEIETKYRRSLTDAEEDFTSWIYQQKAKKKSHFKKHGKRIAAAVFVLTAVFLLVKQTGNDSPSEFSQSLQANITQEQPGLEETTETQAVKSIPAALQAEAPALEAVSASPNYVKTKKEETVAKPKSNNTSLPAAVAFENEQPQKPIVEEEVPAETENAEESPELSVEKKKTLGQKIEGLFEKIKSRREEVKVSETATEGERNSSRRESVPTTVDLTEYADITTNELSNDWMMGIQGLKLSLRNNGNITINKAGVEVRYYSEQNDLLEKKLVYFYNVAPNKSATIAAPDHRIADHVDYKIISASGTDQGYAKQ